MHLMAWLCRSKITLDSFRDRYIYAELFFELFLDEAVVRKPVGLHEQVVRDAQGRIRFHGAFTGGFSAGYFNTVGSKEGEIS